MTTALATEPPIQTQPRVVHETPGRLRVHLAHWPGVGQRVLESRLRDLPGVHTARANPYTSNVLVGFDPAATDRRRLLEELGSLDPAPRADGTNGHRGAGTPAAAPAQPPEEKPLPPAITDKGDGPGRRRARIAVRGLDRDPDLARRVVHRLDRLAGVRARRQRADRPGAGRVRRAPDGPAGPAQ